MLVRSPYTGFCCFECFNWSLCAKQNCSPAFGNWILDPGEGFPKKASQKVAVMYPRDVVCMKCLPNSEECSLEWMRTRHRAASRHGWSETAQPLHGDSNDQLVTAPPIPCSRQRKELWQRKVKKTSRKRPGNVANNAAWPYEWVRQSLSEGTGKQKGWVGMRLGTRRIICTQHNFIGRFTWFCEKHQKGFLAKLHLWWITHCFFNLFIIYS